MRITSQNETADVNYDMCSLTVDGGGDIWRIEAWPAGTDQYSITLGAFGSETAAKQELTRIYESWGRGCSNHKVRKAEG